MNANKSTGELNMHDYEDMPASELLKLALLHSPPNGREGGVLAYLSREVDKPSQVITAAPKVDGRGRPAFVDPTDPKQLPAIIRRCQEHYMHVPCLSAYVKVTKKELLRIVKESTLPMFDAEVETFDVGNGQQVSRLVIG